MYDQPFPADTTPTARRLALLARRIPAGRWAAYSDLAMAISDTGARPGDCGRGAASSLNALTGPPPAINPVCNADTWMLPWHRVRDAQGRTCVHKDEGEHAERIAYNAGLLQAEGGTVHGNGTADASCRWALADMVAAVAELGLAR